MKCVKNRAEIIRVANKQADALVKNDGYSFCPKSEWKVVRDAARNKQKDEQRIKDEKLEKEQQTAVTPPSPNMRDKNKKESRSERNKAK